ncbi:MAG TPA: hypothetical protein VIT43_05925 [Candidatus Dormibacteraeota bacterium]
MKRALFAVSTAAAATVLSAVSALASTGQLSVNPSNVRVGQLIELRGNGCNNPGQPALFMFGNQGDQTGTIGGNDFSLPVDAAGHFSGTYRIPATIDGYQGRGGGAVVAGRYAIYSFPPLCIATVSVVATGPSSIAPTGIGLAPLIGLILIVIGWLLVISRRDALDKASDR